MMTNLVNRDCAKYALAGAALVALARQTIKAGIAMYFDRTHEYIKYNKLGESLAMDHLVEDGQVNLLHPSELVDFSAQIPDVTSLVVSTPNSSPSLVRDGMELEMTPIKEKRHRRIGTHKRYSYASDVIAECRVRFGCPSNNPANRLAVRRFAVNVMYTHGCRVTHVAKIIDDIVEMVFQESDELRASKRLRPSWFGRILSYLGRGADLKC